MKYVTALKPTAISQDSQLKTLVEGHFEPHPWKKVHIFVIFCIHHENILDLTPTQDDRHIHEFFSLGIPDPKHVIIILVVTRRASIPSLVGGGGSKDWAQGQV